MPLADEYLRHGRIRLRRAPVDLSTVDDEALKRLFEDDMISVEQFTIEAARRRMARR